MNLKKATSLIIATFVSIGTWCIFTTTASMANTSSSHLSAVAMENNVQPYSTGCILSFERVSSTSARAQAMASRPGASSITSIIQLQKKSGDSWVNTSSKSSKTVESTSINHIKSFSISSSGSYRIKVTIKYVRGSATLSNYYYKTL